MLSAWRASPPSQPGSARPLPVVQGAWATCEVGNKNKLIKEAAARDAAQAEEAEEEVQAAILKAAPFNVVRRLREENSSGSEVRRLEETFLRLGYNLSDDQADWLQESSEILELRSFADDVVRLWFTAVKRGLRSLSLSSSGLAL